MAVTDTTQGLLDIGAVLGGSAPTMQMAHEVLELLGGVLPYGAARVSAFNPMTRRHRTIASVGLTELELGALDLGLLEHDVTDRHRADGERCTVLWHDTAAETEAVTACLYSRDGRYTGSLHVRAPRTPTPAAHWSREAVTSLLLQVRPLIGTLVDGMRLPSQLMADAPVRARGAVVLADAAAVPLPDRPAGVHLAGYSPLSQAIARALRNGDLPERFRWRDELGSWHVVQTRVIDDGVVVTEDDEELPFGLTPREMDVLTLVAGGFSNPQIAKMLVVSCKTVAKHVEHLLDKLGCTSRAAAAARAVRLGLIELAVQSVRPALS